MLRREGIHILIKLKNNYDAIIALLLLAVEIFLWIYIGEAPYQARYYPRAMLDLSMFLTLLLLVTSLKKHEPHKAEGMKHNKGVYITILITGLYIALIHLVGFYIATMLYLLSVMLFLEIRNKLVLILVPVLTTLFVYLVFNQVLMVFLPEGLLFG